MRFYHMAAYTPNPWGDPQWYFTTTAELLQLIDEAEPNTQHSTAVIVGDDSVVGGRSMNWLVNSNHAIWIDADKILFMEDNPWDFNHAAGLLSIMLDSGTPTFEMPAARVHLIDADRVRATTASYDKDELYTMDKPWTNQDIGKYYAQLVDGNHRALAAIAAGEPRIPVIVGESFWENVLPDDWISVPRPKKIRNRRSKNPGLLVWDPYP